MNNIIISIFGNKIFLEIVNKLKLFTKYKIRFYDNLNLIIKEALHHDHLIIFFINEANKKEFLEIKKKNFPLIVINKSSISKNIFSGEFVEQLIMPFRILELEKKIVSLLARYKFKKSSLINLHGYIINKHERKIRKNDLELQLTEREINFLILFSKSDKPLSRNFILKNVWRYSTESDTHTLETHIHRLRKKILEKFNDNNFIKNSDLGYYI